MTMRLRQRWMLALGGFTLLVTALFGLFAMGFVYTVEDLFLERLLVQEASRQREHFQDHGDYAAPQGPGVMLYRSHAELPADLGRTLAAEPARSEVAGDEGRHYHLLALSPGAQAPWLVLEASQQLIVRPLRDRLLGWLIGWGLAAIGLALLLSWLLAKRVTAPLETLAERVGAADPSQLPAAVATGLPDDEIGAVAHAFDSLLCRTRAFVEREQAFTRDASHELRTPLAVLRLSIERLQQDAATAAASRPSLGAMHAATVLMEQTVQTLLLMAREAGPSQPAPPVRLLALVEQWVMAHADWLDRQALQLEIELERHDQMALPAPVLQLALASLLGNAFAHGQPPGVVRVCLRAGALCVINPSANVAPGFDRVQDAGPGSGHGLGLGILQRLLASHGARCSLASEAGITTASVCVDLPGSSGAPHRPVWSPHR